MQYGENDELTDGPALCTYILPLLARGVPATAMHLYFYVRTMRNVLIRQNLCIVTVYTIADNITPYYN